MTQTWYRDEDGWVHIYDPDRDKGSKEPCPEDNPMASCDRFFVHWLMDRAKAIIERDS